MTDPIPVPSGFLYRLLANLFSKLKELWNGVKKKRATKQISSAQNSLQNTYLHNYLQWKYADRPLFTRLGQFYPVAIYPAPETLWEKPDVVLLSLKSEVPSINEIKDESYRTLAKTAGRPLQNRHTFAMTQFINNSTYGIHCQLGNYFQTLDTCHSLEWEFLSKSHKLNGRDPKSFLKFEKHLALRKKLHALVQDPVANAQHRSAAIGICTLVAFNYKNAIFLWVKKRSASGVAVYAGYFDTIPSFMFQPATSMLEDEFSVTHNIYREYLEEVFDRPEPEEKEGDARYFYGDPCFEYLLNLIEQQKAQIFLSGVAIDLLNLRPEICTLLLIRTPDWYDHHSKHRDTQQRFHFNVEYESLSQIPSASTAPAIGRIRYEDTDDKMTDAFRLHTNNTVPTGAAAFWLGVDVLRKVI